MRKFLGVVIGVVVAMLAITVVDLVGHQVYPPAPGLDMGDAASVARYIADLPMGASLFIVGAWFVGAFAGGWTALKISDWAVATWVVGALIACAGIFNATQIPAPLWMQLSTVLAPALGAWMALHVPGWRRSV
ncbi:hypothetical protein M9980_13500 [Sphingomonas donggukensis]|uniref:Uncharacterized protein n=1 Tax=Sphingomonas donggukensis TaxID=2949093 RepID=A0ABY4TSY8_9SPHN|nr:hypothetical protein [Sphingomonas donggukensis]URW75525.1 hypothetical protein M9980_13500 [Sphingomonas donggukensis]